VNNPEDVALTTSNRNLSLSPYLKLSLVVTFAVHEIPPEALREA
jgi:hypothetical protein